MHPLLQTVATHQCIDVFVKHSRSSSLPARHYDEFIEWRTEIYPTTPLLGDNRFAVLQIFPRLSDIFEKPLSVPGDDMPSRLQRSQWFWWGFLFWYDLNAHCGGHYTTLTDYVKRAHERKPQAGSQPAPLDSTTHLPYIVAVRPTTSNSGFCRAAKTNKPTNIAST